MSILKSINLKNGFCVFVFCLFNGFCSNNSTKQQIVNHTDSTKIKDSIKKNRLQIVDSLLQTEKDNFILWNKKATMFLQVQKKDSAIYCYEESIKLEAKNFDALIALAYLYAEKGDIKTIALCNKILKSESDNLYPKAHYILGVYYSKVHKINNAIQSFEACIKRDWTFLDAYLEKGILLLQSHQNDEALKIFLLAMKTNNKTAETYYWIGRTNEELNHKEEAIKFYKQCLLLDPDFDVASKRLNNLKK